MNLQELSQRYIAFSGLRYTTEAFIDYAIEECAPKYNYALIGPGVSQNPKQPVSLREPHGFQLGGVSIPNGKTNPPHMHFTCEVFMCFRGDWQVKWGFNPDEKHTVITAGDVVSVPTWIYRAFTNVGVDDGFLFSGLGRDDTGGILWGPWTIDKARQAGVYLTEDYRMIDTRRGEVLPKDVRLLEPMSAQEIADLEDWSPERMAQRVVRFANLNWSTQALLDSVLPGHGASMAPVVGLGMHQGRAVIPPVANAHGMSIEWLRVPPGGQVGRHRLTRKQVLVLQLIGKFRSAAIGWREIDPVEIARQALPARRTNRTGNPGAIRRRRCHLPWSHEIHRRGRGRTGQPDRPGDLERPLRRLVRAPRIGPLGEIVPVGRMDHGR